MFKKLIQCAAAGVAAFVLGGVPAFAGSWDEVTAAAKAEGQLVIYHSQLGAQYFLDVVDAFQKETGIEVKLLDGRATEVMERIRAEKGTDGIGDMVFSSTPILQALTDDGTLQVIGDIPNEANLREGIAGNENEYRAPAFVQVQGILVNTDIVSEADMPKDWPDLLDPRWKGKILSNEVRTIGAGMATMGVLWKHYGDDFIKKFVDQDLTFSRDVRLEERRVAMGEFALLPSEILSFYKELDGLPITIVMPESGVPYTPMDMSIMANAPHPNAARLFINYFESETAQLAYANAGIFPVINGVLEQLDPADRKNLDVKLMGTLKREDRPSAVKFMQDVFGKL